jgi:hypothetical protein
VTISFFGMPLVIEPSPGQLSSDAGLLPIWQFDWYRRVCERLRAPSPTPVTSPSG